MLQRILGFKKYKNTEVQTFRSALCFLPKKENMVYNWEKKDFLILIGEGFQNGTGNEISM